MGQTTIRTAAAAEWPAAFALALRHLPEDLRPARVVNALTLVASGEIPPDGIFVACDVGGLRGVQVCVPLPGASGLFWLPKTDPPNDSVEQQLVAWALAWLQRRGTKVAQALLSSLDVPAAGPLVQCGFKLVTRLHYLEHQLQSVLPAPSSRLRFSTYQEGSQDLFRATLQRTYEGTLDCPELNDVRSMEETIAGHIGQGKFRPERWWLAWAGDRPVAVALATEVPDMDVWDLSYLGVVPEARRRGVGRAVAEYVLHTAQAAHADKLILAVDDRNRPALQLYHTLGFLSVDFREVYLYLWK